MKRRVCMMMVANEVLPTILERLPAGVEMTAKQEWFDRAATTILLEGPGLPEWCEEPAQGGLYAWSAMIVSNDGVMRFVQASPVYVFTKPKTIQQQLLEQYESQN